MIISRTSNIAHNQVNRNGQNIFSIDRDVTFSDFIKEAYKSLNLAYPKFYKMDHLCKLAFVGAEVLLDGIDLVQKYNKEEIAMVFLNRASTMNTDKDHQLSIDSRDNYFPSPAIFVYTLPNIMLGEICIRHKFFGENLLLVSDKFDAELLYQQTKLLFDTNKAKAVIAGWVDIENNDYSACMMLVEPENMTGDLKEITTFAPSNIDLIFNNKV